MTPEQLEALADRVEAEAALPAYKQDDLERLIFSSLGTHVLEKRGKDRKAWWYPINGRGARRDDGRAMFGIPRFMSSMDAAAQVMPENIKHWHVRRDSNGFHCFADGDDGDIIGFGHASDECAARVAAGLRAQAHDARKAGEGKLGVD